MNEISSTPQRGSRICIAVAGMHRSGTSAITGVLALLGCELPKHLYGADEGNEKGYFEPSRIININNEILISAGLTYQDWDEFPGDWERSVRAEEFRRRVSVLIEKEYDTSLFVLKDPRICRLLPTFIGALQDLQIEARVILPYRSPLEVARSLKSRGGIFIGHGLLLWIRYLLDAEKASRGVKRAFVCYSNLLANWRSEISRLELQLDVVFPRKTRSVNEDVDKFLEPGLKHFDQEVDRSSAGGLLTWLTGIEQAYDRLAERPDDAGVFAKLDQIAAEFSSSSKGFYSTIKDAYARLEEEQHRANGLNAEWQAARKAHREAEHALALQIDELSRRLEEEQHRANGLNAEWQAARKAHREAEHALTLQAAEAADLRNKLADNQRRRKKMQRSVSWRVTRPIRSLHTISKRAVRVIRKAHLSLASDMEFDPVWYLKAYPDVAAVGCDPLQHYLDHGQREGRLCVQPRLDYELVDTGYDRTKETVVVISHDASRTGAPILALNIIEALCANYNVVAIVLGPGTIIETFRSAATVTLGPIDVNLRHTPAVHALAERVCEAYRPKYAIVNSVESRKLVEPFDEAGVATVLLMHEFAAYTRPLHELHEAIRMATEVITPARIVWDDVLAHFPGLAFRRVRIIPQGQSRIPQAKSSIEKAGELKLIKEAMRPETAAPGTVVIIGCGSVQIRKGVQFFVAVASALMRSANVVPFRFVWVGAGYDPFRDQYSAFLQEQINRSGIRDCFAILGEVSLLEEVYNEADMFFLSSLLDPFPNVAIDAMLRGLPVICFDRATGVSEILSSDATCCDLVVPYGAIDVVAARLLEIGNDLAYRERISLAIRTLAARKFDMGTYVEKLDAFGQGAVAIKHQEARDVATIAADSSFDAEFFSDAGGPVLARDEAIRTFVRRAASGALDRRPCAGFHPAIYAECHPELETAPYENPFAHYLRQAEPGGEWCIELIEPTTTVPPKLNTLRVALHLHLFYPELAGEFIEALSFNVSNCDLLISTSEVAHVGRIEEALGTYRKGRVDIRVVPNIGRDIGPLLTEFRDTIMSGYDIVGHLHSKRSLVLDHGQAGENWRRFCIAHLLGGQWPMMDLILSAFATNPSLGLVFPDDPHVWPTTNKVAVKEFLQRLAIDNPIPNFMFFPLGTMFWAKPAALTLLFELQLKWEDYPQEPVPYDGTMLHAIERILTVVTRTQGFQIAATHVPHIRR